jgi:hypothetical protein
MNLYTPIRMNNHAVIKQLASVALGWMVSINTFAGNPVLSPSMENDERIVLVRNDAEEKVDVYVDGDHFTSYIYSSTIEKPVLYPIRTSKGTIITRGYPLASRPGERMDHPHHLGLWFNYGDVNGIDFWNNSNAIPKDQKSSYGSIVHREIKQTKNGKDEGVLEVVMEWVDHQGTVLLKENTIFIFGGKRNTRYIDRITTLIAVKLDVSFSDNKEGMLAMRMARELELPADKPAKFTDAQGNPTEVRSLNNEGVTGLYRSSEGIEGDKVWGTRGRWMNLSGAIHGEDISVVIMDHPKNVGYPTYWHARGYGLYAANPLGQKAMSGGKEELDYRLTVGKSVTFNHRILVYSGKKATDEGLEVEFDSFTKK